MKIRPNIGPDCFAAANVASREKLTADEINAAFQRVFDYKEKLRASGDITDMADKLRTFAEKEAERTKIAGAMQRRHAALNILVRDRLDQTVTAHIKAGLKPNNAILALMEGTSSGVENARNSAYALRLGYEAKWIGGLKAEISRDRPQVWGMLHDEQFDIHVEREMAELREGGKPGITGNKDAQYVAKVFASYAELSRTKLNKLGASIGKLDGWTGAQTHDDIKMIAAGKDAWVNGTLTKLDIDRTFPDVTSADEARDILRGIYDTIISGGDNKVSAVEKGQRVNPANLAKSLGKSRVLHFKDAQASRSYRQEFGFGTTVSGIISHLRRSSQLAAMMETFGPNPEVMIGSIVDATSRKIWNDPKLSDTKKQKLTSGLSADSGRIKQALDIATGLASRPEHATAAKISADIRGGMSMSKLGAALLSSFGDPVTSAIAAQFRGTGFLKGLVQQIDGLRIGKSNAQLNEIADLLGEGFDGDIGHIASAAAAVDGPIGYTASMQETFFKLNGLTGWTDRNRAVAGRIISAEMGMRAKVAFDKLPDAYRHVLGLHGIDAAKWEAIRKAQFREVNGKTYVTPDRIRDLPDDAVAGLGRDAATAREDLEMALHRFFADETSYGIIETDARSRRTTTLGYRPGTYGGETVRFMMQFKGYPIAFAQRVGGRAAFGFRKGAGAQQAAHIGTIIAGLTMAGYMSMTLKDLAKGYWPPRDPTDPKTWAAAFVQGGAAGIYGDYLFAQVSRFGNNLLETTIGPTIGTGFQIGELILKARNAALSEDEQVRTADWLTLVTQNTPYANLFYVRPAIDYLLLNSLREATSPGYMRRQESRRKTEYGQTSGNPIERGLNAVGVDAPKYLKPFN